MCCEVVQQFQIVLIIAPVKIKHNNAIKKIGAILVIYRSAKIPIRKSNAIDDGVMLESLNIDITKSALRNQGCVYILKIWLNNALFSTSLI